jgi:hypothetical protein
MHHHKQLTALATAIGPREVAALARALPWLETDELARIALTAEPIYERSGF